MMYQHVIVIGIDGCGAYGEKANTPHIDKIFGRKTYTARTVFPTISAECWGAMLLGVSPEVHGLTNQIISAQQRSSDWTPMGTIFAKISEQCPGAVTGSFCDWNPINFGILEPWLHTRKGTGRTEEITRQAVEMISAEQPKLLFLHYDSVDGAGHKYGYGTKEHLAEIEAIDAEIGRVYAAAEAADMLDSTLFVALADHGGTPEGGHGGDTEGEMVIFIGVGGPGVNPGDLGTISILDVPCIIMQALGLRSGKLWEGRVPEGLFC